MMLIKAVIDLFWPVGVTLKVLISTAADVIFIYLFFFFQSKLGLAFCELWA